MIEGRRSIPPKTVLGLIRQQGRRGKLIRFGGMPLANPVRVGGLSSEQSWPNRSESSFSGQDIRHHVFQKPTQEKPREPLATPEIEKITWTVEVHEDYNGQEDLGLILQFWGISFLEKSIFLKSKANHEPGSSIFYSQIVYKGTRAFLILSTFGDIFESQVVKEKKDVQPFFREETYVSQLTTTYDPVTMTPTFNNGLVVVRYNAL